MDVLENMLLGGAFGMLGEYVCDEPEGVKGGAVGLNGDLERGFVVELLSDKFSFHCHCLCIAGDGARTHFSEEVTTVHSSNRSLNFEISNREPFLEVTLSCLTSRMRSYTS